MTEFDANNPTVPESTPDFSLPAEPEAPSHPTNPRLPPPWLWQRKPAPAFWTMVSILSLAVNAILIVLLILLARQLFALKSLLSDQLVGGLYNNFVLMDQARIATTVQVNDVIPVRFDLPVVTHTTVVLTKDTRIQGVTINLKTGGLSITNAPANIVLPAGTQLPIALDITVPVSTSVPVKLTVPVDIPLNQTELHQPFLGLQDVVSPYKQLLSAPPNAWQELPFCHSFVANLCKWIFRGE